MRFRTHSMRWLSRALLILGCMVIAAGAAAPTRAVADPGGNNGTVKVDGGALTNGNANEPHVGCGFAVEWFDFDPGASSTVTFSMQPPTATPNTPGAPTSVQFGPYTLDAGGN